MARTRLSTWSRWRRPKLVSVDGLLVGSLSPETSPSPGPSTPTPEPLPPEPQLQERRQTHNMAAESSSGSEPSVEVSSLPSLSATVSGYGALTVIALVSLAGGRLAAVLVTACAAVVLLVIAPPTLESPSEKPSGSRASQGLGRAVSVPSASSGKMGAKTFQWPPSAPLRSAKSAPVVAHLHPKVKAPLKLEEVAEPLSPTSPLSPEPSPQRSEPTTPEASPASASSATTPGADSRRGAVTQFEVPAAACAVGCCAGLLLLALASLTLGRVLAVVATAAFGVTWAFGKRKGCSGQVDSSGPRVRQALVTEHRDEQVGPQGGRVSDVQHEERHVSLLDLQGQQEEILLSPASGDSASPQSPVHKASSCEPPQQAPEGGSTDVVSAKCARASNKRRRSLFGRLRGRITRDSSLGRRSSCAQAELVRELSDSFSRRRSF